MNDVKEMKTGKDRRKRGNFVNRRDENRSIREC